MSKENWVDFKEIKSRVTMEMVLSHYSVNWLKKKKGYLVGKCPIHKGDNNTAFNVSVSKNNWHCFTGCKSSGRKSGGNVIDFVVAMEGLPENSEGFRDAALKLKQWFILGSPPEAQIKPEKVVEPEKKPDTVSEEKPSINASESLKTEDPANKTLTFELKNLIFDHEYLKGRDIPLNIAREFGIGFYKGKKGKGLMANRVVIPIHNGNGDLVAYAGRAVTPDQEEKDGKYKLPPGFVKTAELFNLHRAREESWERGLILVEGFFDVLHLHQSGFENVVALMGSSMSPEQEKLILESTDRVVLLFDGDDAGKECTRKVALQLVEKCFIKIVRLPDSKQPTDIPEDGLQDLLR